jgi:DNA-directed RNA polymerase sigma subunit (sigma70/sigma32)
MRNQSFTFDDGDYITQKLFYCEIRNQSPLTPCEENTLFKKVREGDREALNRIVKANSKFVLRIARRYLDQGLNLMDLVQEGLLGLVEAAKRYDETRGFKFLTYASHWVKQFLLRALEKTASINESIYSFVPGTEHCIADMLSGDWTDRPDVQVMFQNS